MKRKGLILAVTLLASTAVAVVALRTTQAPAPANRRAADPALPSTSGNLQGAERAAALALFDAKPELSNAAQKAMTWSRVIATDAASGTEVRGVNYRARVDESGLHYKGKGFEVKMKPVLLEQGADVRPLGAGPASMSDGHIARVDRGVVVEEYVFENERVEQLFRLDRPVGTGELRIRIAVDHTLGGPVEEVPASSSGFRDTVLQDGGLVFKDGAGVPRLAYHGAVAVDAAGKRQRLDPTFEDGRIVLAVPDLFMNQAVYPVVVDPWLEMAFSASGGGVSQSSRVSESVSMVLDGSGNPVIAWSDDSSGNFDIYVRFFNGFEWKDIGGSTFPGGISNNPGRSSHPHINFLLNQRGPCVVWDDETSGDFEIYCRLWNGTTWTELGGSGSLHGVSSSLGQSLHPSVTGVRVTLFGTDVTDDITPMIVWQEDFLGGSEIAAAFFFPGDFDSDAGWYDVAGGNVSNTSFGVSERPRSISDRFGRTFVTWMDTNSGNYEIYVRGLFEDPADEMFLDRFSLTVEDGNTDEFGSLGIDLYIDAAGNQNIGHLWLEVGGASASGGGISNTATPSFYPSLAQDGPSHTLYVAWQEGPAPAVSPPAPPPNANIFVRRCIGPSTSGSPDVAAFAGSWTTMTGGVDVSLTNRAVNPSICVIPGVANGIPVVAWQDDTDAAGTGVDQSEIWIRRNFGAGWVDMGDAGSTAAARGISNTTNLSMFPVIAATNQGQAVVAWMDGALGAFDVFVKKYFVVDTVQITLGQSDSVGPVPVGGSTPDSSIQLLANVRGESGEVPAVTGVRAQFEVRPIGSAFIGSPTLESPMVVPTDALGAGSPTGALFSGAPNVMYAWRARAVDQVGRAGPWQSFGTNADTVVDFEVRQTIATPLPSALDQRRTDGITQIPLGATTPEVSVILVGSVTPPDASTPVRFEVEVQPIATAFTGVATAQSAFFSTAQTVLLSHPALSNASYHWRARTVPQTGAPSGWISFGGNPDGQADFIIQAPVPQSLEQFRKDGVTVIPLGGVSEEDGVVFAGTVTSPTGGTVRLDVEVRPRTTPFTGFPNVLSAFVPSGSVASVASGVLAQGEYHWRARTTTASLTSSSWVSFGANADGQIDFQLFVAVPPAPPGEDDDKDRCGLLGAEVLLILAALGLRRRRRS